MILVEIVDYWQYLNKHILSKSVKGIKGHSLLFVKIVLEEKRKSRRKRK